MYIRYPIRNFRCPFCGARVPTETYIGWKPWKCPGCSAELQFSAAYGQIVQLVALVVVLLFLCLTGLRGWQLFFATILLGFVLAVLLFLPFTRVLPPKLETYRPPPWKEDKFVTLFPRGVVDPERPDADGQSVGEQPNDLHSTDGPQKEG